MGQGATIFAAKGQLSCATLLFHLGDEFAKLRGALE